MRRPREIRPEVLQETCRVISGQVGVVEAHAQRIASRGNSDVGEALSGRSYEGVNRGGVDATHPERYALAEKRDGVTEAFCEFQELAKTLVRDARRFRHLGDVLSLVKTTGVSIEGQSRNIGAGDCIVCGRFCPGIRDDRRRSERCDTCFTYWVKHHREKDRPRELWEERESA